MGIAGLRTISPLATSLALMQQTYELRSELSWISVFSVYRGSVEERTCVRRSLSMLLCEAEYFLPNKNNEEQANLL